MAKTETLLINAGTKSAFTTALEAGEIPQYAVAFIKDTKEIYALGQYYPCPYDISELDNKYALKTDVPSLDGGKIPTSYLPSYVDDVLEYNNLGSFPGTGESGKIYVAKDTNKIYRWGGSSYVEISASLALGETASTAYAGNKGKLNATDIDTLLSKTTAIDNYTINSKKISTNPTITKADVGLGNVNNTSDANKPISTATLNALDDKLDILVSGTNIKTINNQSLLGTGNITIAAGEGEFVESLGTSGNYITWKKGSNTNNLTVPYSTKTGLTSNSLTILTYINTSAAQATSTTTFNGSTSRTVLLPDRIHLHSNGEVRASSSDAGKVVYVRNTSPYDLVVSPITYQELSYLDGVTSNILTALNNKANSSHTHSISNINGGVSNGIVYTTSSGILSSNNSCTLQDLIALGGLSANDLVITDSNGRVKSTNIGDGLEYSSSNNIINIKKAKAGNYFGCTAFTTNDGVTEVGHYLDFHENNDDTADYTVRLALNGSTPGDANATIMFPEVTSLRLATLAAIELTLTWTAYLDFSAGAGNSGSDMRFKSEVSNVSNTLEDINKLNVIKYIWEHPDEKKVYNTFGVNADLLLDLGGIYATMVHTRPDLYNTKWVEYDRFGVLAIKGLQEMNLKLELKCSELELKCEKYENALKKVEDKLGIKLIEE